MNLNQTTTTAKIDEQLVNLSDKELEEKIEREHNNLVRHATDMRRKAKQPKSKQSDFEDQVGNARFCIKISGKWVQLYLEFRAPRRIINFYKMIKILKQHGLMRIWTMKSWRRRGRRRNNNLKIIIGKTFINLFFY